jgi:NAD(P)H-flavin reductase
VITAPAGVDPMLPVLHAVAATRPETADVVTLELVAVDQGLPAPEPGQFHMLYAFGVGEVPVSVSAIAEDRLTFTVRAVGAVTGALAASEPGGLVGVRGPFGVPWGLDPAGDGRGGGPWTDAVVVAGGLGLAPVRPVVHRLLADRDRRGRVSVLVGARRPADLLYRDELSEWAAAGLDVRVTVDLADESWTGPVGVVTTLIDNVVRDPASTRAFVCGPEVMMRFTARALADRGVPLEAVRLSTERNMRCAVGLCGHCQFGPHIVCRDGPVFPADALVSLMAVRDL